jgi:hypothetical protein
MLYSALRYVTTNGTMREVRKDTVLLPQHSLENGETIACLSPCINQFPQTYLDAIYSELLAESLNKPQIQTCVCVCVGNGTFQVAYWNPIMPQILNKCHKLDSNSRSRFSCGPRPPALVISTNVAKLHHYYFATSTGLSIQIGTSTYAEAGLLLHVPVATLRSGSKFHN